MADIKVQKFILKTLLSLPTPILRAMSGGAVDYRAARTLDPRFQFLAHGAKRMPSMTTLSPTAARAASTTGLALMSGRREPGVRCEDLSMEGPGGLLPLRLYRPERQDPTLPLIVFAHFGGGVIGDLETCDAFCSILAKDVRTAVLSVDYRLAPEHKFPAGLDDVLAAYRWGRDNAGRFGTAPDRAVIGGDSMGGNFAAVIPHELRRLGEAQPDLQLLIYPAVDVASETASMTVFGDSYPLSRDVMEWFMAHYMSADTDPTDLRLSPIKAESFAGLAPAVIATAGFDPLVDQGGAYAKVLREAGVCVTYRCYDSLAHGFTAFTGALPGADAACREIAALVQKALHETSAL